MKRIILGDNADVLPTLPDSFARLVYVDPPFNTGRTQKRDRVRVTVAEGEGSRGGFGGRRYNVESVESSSYADDFEDFEGFLMPRIRAALRANGLSIVEDLSPVPTVLIGARRRPGAHHHDFVRTIREREAR